MVKKIKGNRWKGSKSELHPTKYTCGYCHETVSSSRGYYYDRPGKNSPGGKIRMCPDCGCPTFFQNGEQWPGNVGGESVDQVPELLNDLYEEARNCIATKSYTSSVLTTRKLLMHLAVDQGASENESFKSYVDWLDENNFTPPNSQSWVDHIRKKGNEANHEIILMSQSDAEELLTFCAMLLKFNYEFPTRMASDNSN